MEITEAAMASIAFTVPILAPRLLGTRQLQTGLHVMQNGLGGMFFYRMYATGNTLGTTFLLNQ